ncbi:hypothetical protein MKJ01_05585 [Chryseobacterium sp. SSA4.19]|uniref:hypothetical protein n=1 Tax=Chryseobacterium sp. SSA4.19 TaxID=2919915 RepID=UPI001F4ECAE7|nr:hypothetical protein [Chryseobacterium sp. SSA4.19]MCJ8153232.1 hypothetical protein [Chryseobacterium sp. SSA4.19]
MEKDEQIRLMILSLNQNQKMFDELIKALNLDIKDENNRLLRTYSEQNKAVLKQLLEVIN